MDQKEPLTLALETGIGSGSIALLRGRSVLFSEKGRVARAGEVVVAVQSLMADAGFRLPEVDQVAVSIGPGSYTGIRIGIATALGLNRALQIQTVGVPMLKALANSIEITGERACATPVGAGRIAVQRFAQLESVPYTIPAGALVAEIRAYPETNFILFAGDEHEQFGNLGNMRFSNVHSVSANLAEAVGRFAADFPFGALEPIYL